MVTGDLVVDTSVASAAATAGSAALYLSPVGVTTISNDAIIRDSNLDPTDDSASARFWFNSNRRATA